MNKICNLDEDNCLEKATWTILNGGIIVYPTDTLYGFGVDARNSESIEKLNTVKGRKGPLSIIVSGIKMLRQYGKIPYDKESEIINLLPGKVTIILPATKSNLSGSILGKKNTVGIRIPEHDFPVKLVKKLGFPITTTSVNRSGEKPLNNPAEIMKTFGKEIDLLIDRGTLPPSTGSRIIDFSGTNKRILRKGDTD